MDADEKLLTDALCDVFSRYAYMKDMEQYRSTLPLHEDFTVFVFDINGLKTVNDTIGHDAGDELIIGVARCIKKVIGDTGKYYRVGGDEFVVVTNMEKETAKNLLTRLEAETKRWSRNNPKLTLSISPGYANSKEYKDLTAEELIKKADRTMYVSKAAYYMSQGTD